MTSAGVPVIFHIKRCIYVSLVYICIVYIYIYTYVQSSICSYARLGRYTLYIGDDDIGTYSAENIEYSLRYVEINTQLRYLTVARIAKDTRLLTCMGLQALYCTFYTLQV